MLKEDLGGKEILDIGTGSGCIAISLAKNFPNSKVSALDISNDALEVAKENGKLNNVEVNFINADIFKYKSDKKYDVIVSNPPYVTEHEKSSMKNNVLNFEPDLALFVDDNEPLKYYNFILSMEKLLLKSNGLIFFEVNEFFFDELILSINFKKFILINCRYDVKYSKRHLIIKKISTLDIQHNP